MRAWSLVPLLQRRQAVGVLQDLVLHRLALDPALELAGAEADGVLISAGASVPFVEQDALSAFEKHGARRAS